MTRNFDRVDDRIEAHASILFFLNHMGRPAATFRYIPPGIMALSLAVIYSLTMAPGITWANHGSDGGDLITAAATGGVAHPSGYPVYLLLARWFQLLPIGSLAYRTNLLSAVAAVFACLIVYHLVTRYLSPSDGNRSWPAGVAAAYAFGLSPLLWSQAVITEVYALHSLFVAILLFLSSEDSHARSSRKQLDRLSGLVFGLSMGNHITTILMLPALFPPTVLRNSPLKSIPRLAEYWQLEGRSLIRRFTWLVGGLLVYLTLPVRALSKPPVNWGNPVTWEGFRWLVSGRLYQDQLFILTSSSIWARIQSAAAQLLDEFGFLGLILGLMGLIIFYKPAQLYRNTIWAFTAFSVFAIGYDTRDSFLHLIPAYLCFSIWIGIGLGRLMAGITQRIPRAPYTIGLIFLVFLFIQAVTHWTQVDASHDLRAEQFGEYILAQAPANAIVFAKGDEAIFTLWYFHHSLHKRPDLAVVVPDLLHFAWYQETLLANYPNLELPGPFPFAETVAVDNPDRPVCYVESTQSTGIDCSPPRTP